jgi:hypothetical protein
MACNIPSPKNITNVFANWLNEFDLKKLRMEYALMFQLHVSLFGYIETILFLNFNKMKGTNILRVILLVAHWIRL